MENRENQGSYAQTERQWVCPDCETVNTGDSCAICGCPRPQKKPEGEAQETAVEQGSYQETVREWICPDCETNNTGKTCTVCGCPRPEPEGEKDSGEPENTSSIPPFSEPQAELNASAAGSSRLNQRFPKKAVIAAVAAVVIVVSALAGIALGFPNHRYRNACRLLESGQYEQAYQAFSAISDYRDSSALRNQTVVQWADHLEKNGEYDKAVNTLAYLPADEQSTQMKKQLCVQWAQELRAAGKYTLALKALEPVSEMDGIPSMITEIRYSKGKWLLNDENNYGDAYQEFTALGNYQHSEQYASQAADKWIQRTLDNPDVTQASLIKKTVKLSSDQAKKLYQELYTRDLYTYDSSDGSSASYYADDLPVRIMLLETLPAGFYPNRARLSTLFEELDEEQPGLFVQEHRDLLETLWDMPVVQNIVRHDLCIDEWLLGTWRTGNNSYYIKFTQSDSGGYNTSYNVPWVAEPAGTTYYYINNLTFSWADKDNNILADVYRFKLLEPNKIEVYAFKNKKTYTMTRK